MVTLEETRDALKLNPVGIFKPLWRDLSGRNPTGGDVEDMNRVVNFCIQEHDSKDGVFRCVVTDTAKMIGKEDGREERVRRAMNEGGGAEKFIEKEKKKIESGVEQALKGYLGELEANGGEKHGNNP